jgi:serine/threonine protein phosphatase PrpC
MKQPLCIQPRSLLRGLLAFCLALGVLFVLAPEADAASLIAPSARVAAASPLCATPDDILAASTCEGVALAQLATVRIVADYTFTLPTGTTPLLGHCTGLGVLVQSTDPTGKNGSPYLLTTSAVLAQAPCKDGTLTPPAKQSFTSIKLSAITVYLSTAYSGTSGTNGAPPSLSVPVADASIPALANPLKAVLVPITVPAEGLPHDYPTVLGLASDQASAVIDLKQRSGEGLTSSQLNSPPFTATTTIAPQYLTPATQPAPQDTVPSDTSPGAPVIDQAGNVVSLAGSAGNTVPIDQILSQLADPVRHADQSCPTVSNQCLSKRWKAALDDYYQGNKAKAQAEFAALAQPPYADFGGAQAFANAIVIPATPVPSKTPVANTSSFLPDKILGISTTTVAFAVLVVLLLLVFIMTLLISVRYMRRRRTKKQAASGRSFPTRSRASGQVGSAYAASSQAAGATASYADAPQNGPARRTIICPRCGTQNNPGSSTCANCGLDLPQGPAGTSGVGRGLGRSISGGPQPLNLPPLAAPPAPDIAEMPTMAYQNPGGSNPAMEVTLPTVPAVSSGTRQEEATIVMRGRQRPMLGVKVSTKSDRGIKRAHKDNEDNYLAIIGTWRHNSQLQPFGAFVVADGMGGHANGPDASRMAVETIYQSLVETLLQKDVPDDALGEMLQQAVQNANQMIYQQNQRDHADMGCTLTAALVTGNEAYICNVGDSRTYLLTPNDHLQRITTDHSIVESLVAAGVIQKDDVYTHPKRNQIYRSLGEKEAAEIDLFRQRLSPGDKLLLCCDGLWEMIRDPDLEQTLRQDDLPQITEKLIQMANDNGGVDNITAIVVKVMEETKPAKQPMIQSLAHGPANLNHPQR